MQSHSFSLLTALGYCNTDFSNGAERWNIFRQITTPFFCTACQLQSRSGQDAPEVCSSSESFPWRISPMSRTNICQHQCSNREDNAVLAVHVTFSFLILAARWLLIHYLKDKIDRLFRTGEKKKIENKIKNGKSE